MTMFDLSKVEETNDFDAIPAGTYDVYAEKCEWKVAAKGHRYLNVQFKIFGEEYNNRVIFTAFYVNSDNAKAVSIALGQIKKALIASGISDMNFTSEEELSAAMSKVRCSAIVKIEKSSGYDDKNKITNFAPLTESDVSMIVTSDDVPF